MQSPELAMELRSARPTVSAELRERVRAVAAQPSPQRRQFAFPFKRAVLVAAPAALALAVGGALVHGLVNSGSEPRVSGGSAALVTPTPPRPEAPSAPPNFRPASPDPRGGRQQDPASVPVQAGEL